MKLTILLISMLTVMVFITTAFAEDVTPPTVNVPSDMYVVVYFASDSPGDYVSFEVTATDNVGVVSGPNCTHASGDLFPIGKSIVTCTATDAIGNTGTGIFTITVAFTNDNATEDSGRDYMYVMFVNSTDSRYSNSFAYTTVTTAIYSTVHYPAVITIYVEDANNTPVGVAIFKTTLLEGVTPIEYGFTIPIECYYNTYDHRPICNTEAPKKIYVNIFTDSSLTEPLVPEASGITIA